MGHCRAVEAGEQGFPIVQVVWQDALAVALEWATDVTPELRLTTTVGYLIQETEEALVLVSIINSEHVGHGIVIPRSCVKSQSICKVKR